MGLGPYFRDRHDYIIHIAVLLACGKKEGDILKASDLDVADARELMARIGIRVPEEPAKDAPSGSGPATHKHGH